MLSYDLGSVYIIARVGLFELATADEMSLRMCSAGREEKRVRIVCRSGLALRFTRHIPTVVTFSHAMHLTTCSKNY